MLIKCPECGFDFSHLSRNCVECMAKCPKCGHSFDPYRLNIPENAHSEHAKQDKSKPGLWHYWEEKPVILHGKSINDILTKHFNFPDLTIGEKNRYAEYDGELE